MQQQKKKVEDCEVWYYVVLYCITLPVDHPAVTQDPSDRYNGQI